LEGFDKEKQTNGNSNNLQSKLDYLHASKSHTEIQHSKHDSARCCDEEDDIFEEVLYS
jgi:hypothetical protein